MRVGRIVITLYLIRCMCTWSLFVLSCCC